MSKTPRIAAMKPDRKSTRLNSSHANISYAVFCLKKKTSHAVPLGSPRVRDDSPHQSSARARRTLHYPAFSFNDAPTTDIYTLSLHDALPICNMTSVSATPMMTSETPAV